MHSLSLLATDLRLNLVARVRVCERSQIFLNALRQQTARVSRVPVDELKLVSCWESGRLDRRVAPLTLTVTGMLLQGCNFDGQKLSESLLDSVRT